MELWDEFLRTQEDELGTKTVDKWLKPLKAERWESGKLHLSAEDSFQVNWFNEHIKNKALLFLNASTGKKCRITLNVNNALPPKPKAKKPKKPLPTFKLNFDHLDPTCQLEHFVISEENILLFKLLGEVISAPVPSKPTFNPIYIYGKSGSGKTHLLMGLTQKLRKNGIKALYARADTFTDHVVFAIRAGEMSTFRQAYRSAEVLLIDDVQIFARKGATQEEFFHTFNTLHLEGKQIILTSTCPPMELNLIEPRLISRFEWGIVLPLKSLKDELLLRMLNKKSAALQFPLPPDIATYLYETFSSGPKALVRALEALTLRLHLDGKATAHALTPAAVQHLLADLIEEERKEAITPQKILQAVAEQYGILVEDILGKAQTRDCVIPRQLAMYLCREHLKLPFMRIGEIFSRDHSTVLTSVKQTKLAIEKRTNDLDSITYAITKKLEL